ncbi:MAG TPA: hypothetical protein VHW09_20235 [Bryobacteraceae bacterium]|jgi:hypothetical protein|nr:hypothetical protein [Bryobacteraceae bacterium]
MASPPIPPSLEHLAAQPFSFYPPIVNVEQNEWLFRKATWSEIQVLNCKSGEEVWISRRFLGDVSRVDDPVLIVGLSRELELKGGMVVPFQRRIIEMPMAVNAPAPPHLAEERGEPAPVVGIRLEPSDRRVFRLILMAVGTLVGLSVVAIAFTHVGELRQKNIVFVGSDQSYLSLTSHDDYLSAVQKLGGPPSTDHTQETGTILYRALAYPDRRYTVILMGADRNSMSYIGTVDQNWHAIRSVNAHTDALLRGLKRF